MKACVAVGRGRHAVERGPGLPKALSQNMPPTSYDLDGMFREVPVQWEMVQALSPKSESVS
jgi:hypothetical protein